MSNFATRVWNLRSAEEVDIRGHAIDGLTAELCLPPRCGRGGSSASAAGPSWPMASPSGPPRAPSITVAIEAGLWRVAVSDRGDMEVLGSLLPRPGEISEAHSVLVGYPRDFVEQVMSLDEKQVVRFDSLPLLVSRDKATRLSGDQLTS